MRLELEEADLLEEHQGKIPCSATKFEHFKPRVQEAIIAAGAATYYIRKGIPNLESYNAIYPPATE